MIGADVEIDNMVQLYESGESISALGRRYGCSNPTITKRLRDRGIEIRHQDVTVDVDALIELYNSGVSVKALAKRFECSRDVIVRRLESRGITPRNRSESMYLRMGQTSPEERMRLTDAAHDAVRGSR